MGNTEEVTAGKRRRASVPLEEEREGEKESMTLDSRVAALEALLHAVPSNIPPAELTPPLSRVRAALSHLPGSALFRVPADY